jgi:CheY-like chemotaxis protein
MKVFLADDEPQLHSLLGKLLTMEGHQLTAARSWSEAKQRLRGDLPDVLVLDLMMPSVDGEAALKELRADPRTSTLPVIIYTCVNLPEIKQAMKDAGATDFIIKGSLGFDDLLERLHKAANIPRAQRTASPNRLSAPQLQLRDALWRTTRRVLVVDDDPVFTRCVKIYLTRNGYSTTVVANGREALAVMGQVEPDIILLDMAMPVIDGLDFVRCVRRIPQWAHLPIFVLTAASPREMAQLAETGAVQRVLWKSSFSLNELLAEIDRFVMDYAASSSVGPAPQEVLSLGGDKQDLI